MNIRDYRAEDRDALIALWQACDLTRPWNDPATDIAFCVSRPESTILVGEQNGKVVASVMTGHDGHRGWLYYLAVEPSLQKSGLGRRMVEAAEAWLKARGVPKVMLMVRPENGKVRAFYDALGYEEEPRVIFAKRLDGK
ncbi:MAG TPA: GNAT family acetyltransferase [Ferrovibrio sp.]|uniref:GNAT family acetyltransferase n=1 Tax=Ferrovibrio sp. TaxID=1917215 RepID=UPI002B4B8554|nr:GNAT family acetyltransferase [Ferrovibrio sp.]HLT77429.1 GNAT family acetyltransferase [Ferrovibrio sp.]